MPQSKQERAAYHKVRRLERKLGCIVHTQVEGGTTTYWVHAPESVYGGEDYGNPLCRKDPCEGMHSCCSWYEVLGNLELYRLDLFFHRLGVDSELTEELIEPCRGIGQILLMAWVKSPYSSERLVLADWLLDQGHTRLADWVGEMDVWAMLENSV